ncbi:transcriptional regulator with XRE-family HTH domain [Anaerotaenia torta]|uniref:helix-turn-helix domain-containing protein n=1 Tax=Anaerotaenia torta TaxID=433293 RepID=UPI003D21933B
MDQVKIGKFIAQKRKEKNITQEQLAEHLGITNKAVSKWECGRGLPDAALMKPLSEILGITVSELLNGESLEEEQMTHSEKTILDLTTIIEALKKQKRMIIYAAIGLLSMNVGDRLPELLKLDMESMNSQLLPGILDGLSAGLFILGVAFWGAGAALFIRNK